MSVVEPEGSLDPTDFVVVGLGPEYEPGDPELLIVSPGATGHNTPEVWSQVTGVQRKIKMFFSPGFLSQFQGQQITPLDEIEFLPLGVELFEDSPPLNISAGDVVWVVVVSVLVWTFPIPVPPVLQGLALVRVHANLLGNRMRFPVFPAGRHLQDCRGGEGRCRNNSLQEDRRCWGDFASERGEQIVCHQRRL